MEVATILLSGKKICISLIASTLFVSDNLVFKYNNVWREVSSHFFYSGKFYNDEEFRTYIDS